MLVSGKTELLLPPNRDTFDTDKVLITTEGGLSASGGKTTLELSSVIAMPSFPIPVVFTI